MRTVFFDVDTQFDFLFPTGALYAPGAEAILEKVAALNRFAAASGATVISTMDAHAENDPEFLKWPPHCIAGTLAQRKPDATLLGKRLVIPNAEMAERIDGFEQIVLEKVHVDCFTNPNLGWLLEALNADRYVVYGLVTEVCVRHAAWGLLETGKPVTIVTDAVRALSAEGSRATLEEFESRGGVLATAGAIL